MYLFQSACFLKWIKTQNPQKSEDPVTLLHHFSLREYGAAEWRCTDLGTSISDHPRSDCRTPAPHC